MSEGIPQSRALKSGPDAASAFVDCLVRAGYQRRPPQPLLADTGGTTLFTSVTTPHWRRALTAPPGTEGAVVLQWILNTSRLVALPPATPPSAGRTIGAVWTGARPYTKALSDLLEALREAGTSPDELTYLLSAAPGDATPTTQALLGLGIEPGRVLAGDRLPGVPLRMDPVLGPRLTLRRRSGAERFGHCDASCPCGCHVSVAHIQFVERRRTAEGLTPVPQPLFEVVASEHGLTPRTGTRPAVPLLLEPLVTSIETLLAGPTGPHPVFLADLASAAALLLGEGMVPGPRGGPYVVRKLLRTICTELATHGLPVTLLTPVITAAEVSYRVPLGLPQLPEKCWEYVAGECVAFERILRRGRRRVRGTGPSSERPHDTAQELIRLRSEWGVPLGVSLRWYREAGMDPSLVSLALADLRVGRTVPAPRSPESVAHP